MWETVSIPLLYLGLLPLLASISVTFAYARLGGSSNWLRFAAFALTFTCVLTGTILLGPTNVANLLPPYGIHSTFYRFSSVALLYTREAALSLSKFLIPCFDLENCYSVVDIQIEEWVISEKRTKYLHVPSLFQHVGVFSSSGSPAYILVSRNFGENLFGEYDC